MKKKIVGLMLLLTFAVSSGCSGNTENDVSEQQSADATSVSATPTVTEAPTPTIVEKEDSLATLEEYLLGSGLLSGERTEMAVDMIGATSGFKYEDSYAEIYEFDETSDTYKNLVETNSVTLSDFNMTLSAVSINGKYALFASGDGQPGQELIDAFNSYSLL